MSKQCTSILALSGVAAATLTADRFVTLGGAVPAAGAAGVGVVRQDAVAGDAITIDVIGTAVVESSAAIAANAAIETTNDGRAVTRSTGTTVARALQAAGGAGEFIEVLLICS